MANIYTINVGSDGYSMYEKTDSVKRTIIEAIKSAVPNYTKDDVITVITNPTTLKVVAFNERIRLSAKIINSTRESNRMVFIFDDRDLYAALKYWYKNMEGVHIVDTINDGTNPYAINYKYGIIIDKGAFYKLKFSVEIDK